MKEIHPKFIETFSMFPAVPVELPSSLWLYFCYGIPPGGFMTAVLCNDFCDAVCRAHPMLTAETLRSLAKWLINCAPSDSFGSADKMRRWQSLTNDERKDIMILYRLRPSVVEILKGEYTA